MSYLMILGAGTMQIPAIIAARELGLKTLVADASSTAPAIPLADQFVQIDLVDKEALASYALEFQKSHQLVGVFTAGTDFSASVAFVASQCQLPCHPYEATLRATDKKLMRECFQEHAVPSPQFISITAKEEIENVIAKIQTWSSQQALKLVVKPCDSMGARGVMLVDNISDLPQAILHALAFSRSGSALIEEFMDGPEISIDSLVYDGQLIPCGIADRHIFYPPYFIEMGHTLPTALSEPEVDEIIRVFTQAVHAIGLTHGAAKGDIKITSEGVKIGEIAARLSGGYMSGWTYPHASGVNLTKNAIQLAIGEKPTSLTPPHPLKTSAEWSFISIPGKIAKIMYLDQAKATPYITESFLRVKEGDEVFFPENNVQKCGNFIATHENRALAENAAHIAAGTVFLRLEAGSAQTEQFLFQENWPTSAWRNEREFNGLNHMQLLERFRLITDKDWDQCVQINEHKFSLATQRGGLQGAVWFYDTYIAGRNT